MQDPQQLYYEIVSTSLEKIRKALPKKLKPLKETIISFQEQLKSDKQLDANKYFPVYKECLESKDAKLIELTLNHIYKLISNSFLTGNSTDLLPTSNGADGQNGEFQSSPQVKRKLIDTIIQTVCACKNDKKEDVQMLVVRILLTMVTGLTCEVHYKSLRETMDTLFTIFTNVKNPENQVITRAAITQITNLTFQRMEEYNAHENEFRGRRDKTNGTHKPPVKLSKVRSFDPVLGQSDASIIGAKPLKGLDLDMTRQHRFSLPANQLSLPLSPGGAVNSTFAAVLDQMNMDYVDIGSPTMKDGPVEKYIGSCLRHLVDDVCIYNQKKVEVEADLKEDPENENLKLELEYIPLRSVPASSLDPNDGHYRVTYAADLENERGNPAGLFGWCFMCRLSANLYCKDTRVPICSVECKLKHAEELENLAKPPKTQEALATTMYIDDALEIFEYLCKMSGKETGDLSIPALRNKTVSLELIASIMTNPGSTFLSAKGFKNIVKNSLCGSILANSISTDKSIFAYSIEIITSLVTYFKETLKTEVGVFLQNILIHMLESNNSSYNHRSLALQVLHKLTTGPKMMLELYVNYDCSINSVNLVEQIVEILCKTLNLKNPKLKLFIGKIAQGKFARPEYNSFILPPQELYLKTMALDSLVTLVKSLMHFTQDFQKNEKKKVEETSENKKAFSSSLKDERDFDDKDSSDGEDNRGDVSVFEKEGEIENQRKLKKELQKAIEKFNTKFKVGIKYLAQLGFINLEDPKTVGAFFMNTPGLSKEMLGEYFGDENEFNIKVLTEWMDLMDFTGLTLDDGLRKLLTKFILPGEGQKIDRIVQVFAGKHFKDNPNSFNSSNAAYTLSYLLIMLQTDAHNPHIKEKERMKLPGFISLARGINDGENLPEEELTGYYNRILETPLGIHTKGEAKEAAESLGLNVKRKEERFRKETKKMLERGQDMIKQKQDELYYKVKNIDNIKPLFKEVIWNPVLTVLSFLLEKSEDPKIISLCIEGFKSCILLTGLHGLHTERDTFVQSFTKFTNLFTIREIKDKTAQCLKAVLYLASKHGHLLRKSWLFVLESISTIDYYLNRIQNTGKGNDARNDITDQIELKKSEVIRTLVDVHTLNCIFSRSNTFELDEIMDFITCICRNADEELKSQQYMSTYSLQKLVEVAHFNLDRVKFIWQQIWNVTREYISNVAIHSTPEVAFFAVDSLKQLSLKFLIKEELSNLEFQKEFLRPFGTIFQRVENNDIKELVLTCCSYIISHVGDKLKSGWKTILDILGLGAESDKKNIIHYSFSISENIMNESLDSLKELLSEFIILLIKFSKCKSEEIAVKALDYLKKMIGRMIQDVGNKPFDTDNDTILEKSNSEHEASKEVPTSEGDDVPPSSLSEGHWITLLTSLFTLCSDSKKKIRREGTTILFEILKSYGKEFSQDFWQVVLSGVIKPLFDEIQFYFQSKNEEELLSYNDSCREIFSNMIDVYYIYYDKLGSFTEDFLKILMHCIDNPKGNLAKISINALKQLITQCHTKFSENEWSLMVNICSEIVENTTPYQLLEYQAGAGAGGKTSARGDRPKKQKSVSISSEECLTQCIVQLLMIALIKDVADTYDQYLSDDQMKRILETLNASYQFARNFNEQIYLRYCLWKNGLMREMDQLPGLLKQGKEALGAYILILYKLYERKVKTPDQDPSAKQQYLNEFITLGLNLMKTICVKSEEYIARIKDRVNKPEYLGVESPLRISDEIFSFEDQTLKESFMRQSDKLTVIELEKEIMHTRTVLSVVFLPKLASVEDSEVKGKMKELVRNLVDVSFYCTPKPLAIGEISSQTWKAYAINDESLILIRMILNKYFEYNFSKMKG